MDLTHATTQKPAQKPMQKPTHNSRTDLNDLSAQLHALELAPQVQAHTQAWASQVLSQFQAQLIERDAQLAARDAQLRAGELKIQALALEIAHLRRMRFGAKSEAMSQMNRELFDESSSADIGALNAEVQAVSAHDAAVSNNDQTNAKKAANAAPTHPGRTPLPAHLPRIEHRHDTHTDGVNKGKPLASCGCNSCGAILSLIGEDISEQLDVTPR